MIKVGILLSGCGFYDGTEIAEAVLSALAVERAGARAVHIAPEIPQMHTVDHLTGSEVEGDVRDVLGESARVARGRVKSLSEAWPGELGALIIPGGQGAVKNLMTHFARLGEKREVVPQVAILLADLTGRKAPIGAISLGRTVVQTFFNEPLSPDDMQMSATDIVVDEQRRLVFTPGFLTGASLPDVAIGIDKLVQAVLRLPARELHVIH
jgi:enhancing lycopene biosynthesis protein 2